jgi:putative DNA primase/helicase
MSLMEFLSDARQGQLGRMVDVPAEIRTGTAFETIAGSDIATAGRQFYSATAECHGAVGYDWLVHLVALGPKQIKAELKQLRQAWWALPQVVEIANRAHPQVVSVINRFALVAAALQMASAAGIVPWAVDDINVGVIACMQRWLQQRGNIDTAGETLRQIKQRQHEIAATLDYRFIHVRVEDRRLIPASKADSRKIEVAHNGEQFDGYVKGEHVLVTPEAWRRL